MMTIVHQQRAIGVLPTQQAVESALQDLQQRGVPLESVSVIARDAAQALDSPAVNTTYSGNKTGETVAVGAVTGGALGGIAGLLVGLGTLLIPGVGPIVVGGTLATALATAASGGAIGAAAGGLFGGLVGVGIPEEHAKTYSDRVHQGEYLILIEGTQADIDRAQTILNGHNIQDWGIYPL